MNETRTLPALLVIDAQRGFLAVPEAPSGLAVLVEKVNELIDLFHARNLPVVHVLTTWNEEEGTGDLNMKENGVISFVQGTPEAEEFEGIQRRESDAVVSKTRHSAFVRTNLETVLWERGVNTVVLTGFSANACIGLTAIDAYERDIMPVLADEAILSMNAERENGMRDVLKNEYAIEPVTNERIKELLNGWLEN
jgi:nicotinamidase-related amidase